MKIPRSLALAVAWLAMLLPMSASVVISEFLASNQQGIEDSDGDNSDWIELENIGPSSVSLAGWHLTDDPESPNKWPLPAINLGSGERLLIFASGKDRRDSAGELHTNFSLAQEGEYLGLYAPGGVVATEFAPKFPPQRTDVSYGRGLLISDDALVHGASAGKFHLPTSDALGNTWTAPGFDDASWSATTGRLGYQTGGPRPGQPIAYWPFDGSAEDASGNGHTAELRGPSYVQITPSQTEPGESLQFVGSSQQYVSVALDVSESAYTCSFWFRTSSPNTGLFVVSSGDLGSGGHDRHLYLVNGNLGARTYSNETITTTGRNFADGSWHHVVLVYGGSVGGQKIYADGQLVAQGSKAYSDFDWQDRINIGFSNDASGNNQYFTGQIDDVAIWSEALSPASIQQLYQGVSPIALAGYGPFITTNVEAAMRNIGTTAFTRFPFTVGTRDEPYNRFVLRTRYDDGFVAYLDGVEVARRNAPATPAFDTPAVEDRPAENAIQQEEIDLASLLPELTTGNHVLAVHALNDSAGSPDFLLNVELLAGTIEMQAGVFFTTPTPGEPNSTGATDFVADLVFSPGRGFYDTAQQVTISCATPGATIAWTVDGTEPSPTNGTQTPAAAPDQTPLVTVNVSKTTNIRAMAYKPGSTMEPTRSETHSYLFVATAQTQGNSHAGYSASWAGRAADYAVDPNVVNTTLPGYSFRDGLLSLPSVVMTLPPAEMFSAPNGIYYNTAQRGIGAERKVTLEWINPDGEPGWIARAGVRLHGNSSRSHSFTPKHPLRLFFRQIYGESKLRRKVFADSNVEKFDQLLLRPCSTDSFPVIDGNIEDGEQRWNNDKATYLRDQWMRDALNELGHPTPHGTYVHLFINHLYWGMYNLAERPTASFFADHFGGHKDEWDVIKDFAELNDGNMSAWNEMFALVNAGLSTTAQMQRLLGNNPDGTRNPNYPVYLHLPSFIDYMIVHIASGAEDWPDHNFWAGRRRGPESEGFRFIAWDQEISNDSLTRTSGRGSDNRFEEVDEPNCPAIIYHRLRQNPVFRQMFRERVHELLFNDGKLSPAMNRLRWAIRQQEIDKAIAAESARWGDGQETPAKKRETTWLTNMNFMQTPVTGYWDQIFPIQIQRFRRVQLYPSIDQPEMSKRGGSVPVGYGLHLTSDQPFIYYTLDGTDPMAPDGQPAPGAKLYDGGVQSTNIVPAGANWRYLVTNVDQGTAWRAIEFDDSAWPEGPAQLGYGDGDEATVIGYGGNPSSRYITTYFRKTFNVTNVAGILNLKFHLLRDDGAVVFLNGQEVARSNMHPTNPISWGTTALSNVGGQDETTRFYEYVLDPALLVEGENVLAVEVHKVSASDDDLSFDARLEVLASAAQEPLTLTQSGTVKARARSTGGEWSGMNAAYFFVDTEPAGPNNVVISEIHYHPAPPTAPAELAVSADPDDFEFIELMNIGATSVDFTGCSFTEGLTFDFPSGFTLAPGQRAVIVRNVAAFEARYGNGRPIIGIFGADTGLANSGEKLSLTAADGTIIKSFTYDDNLPWPKEADGGGPSLVLISPMTNPDHSNPANWQASSALHGTPGQGPANVTFQSWAQAYFQDATLPTDDSDGDGLAHLLEYAIGGNPNGNDADLLPRAGMVSIGNDQYLSITIQRRNDAADLSFQFEAAVDVESWNVAADLVLVERIDHGDTATETWRLPQPVGTDPRRFLRLRIELIP